MGNAVGLTTRIATGVETTYGTAVVTDRFIEFDSEGLERQNEVIRSNALGSGRVGLRRGSRSVVAARHGQGPITMEVVANGMGRLFRNLIGGTPTIAQQAATAAYLQTHTLGTTLGKSLTIQKQLKDESDVAVGTFTFLGSKFVSGEFAIDKKGKLMLTLNVDARDVVTNIAAAAPSLTNTKVFHYRQGSLSIGGVAAASVQSAGVTITRNLETDDYSMGNSGVKDEPSINDFPEVTGTLTAKFADLTYYNMFADDSPAELVLEFIGDEIAAPHNERLTITVPEIRLTGETPKVGGPGLVLVNHPWEAQWDGTSADLTLEYMSSDTAI